MKNTITINGTELNVNIKFNAWQQRDQDEPISLTVAQTAKLVRSYIKAKFPKVGKVQVKSESYSMGNSINVFFSGISSDLFDKIDRELNNIFQKGKFNGMNDSYEYGKKSMTAKYNGSIVEYGTLFMFVDNRNS